MTISRTTGAAVFTELDFLLDDRSFVYAEPLFGGRDQDAAEMKAHLELCHRYKQAALEIDQEKRIILIEQIVADYAQSPAGVQHIRGQAELMIARHREIYPEHYEGGLSLVVPGRSNGSRDSQSYVN